METPLVSDSVNVDVNAFIRVSDSVNTRSYVWVSDSVNTRSYEWVSDSVKTRSYEWVSDSVNVRSYEWGSDSVNTVQATVWDTEDVAVFLVRRSTHTHETSWNWWAETSKGWLCSQVHFCCLLLSWQFSSLLKQIGERYDVIQIYSTLVYFFLSLLYTLFGMGLKHQQTNCKIIIYSVCVCVCVCARAPARMCFISRAISR